MSVSASLGFLAVLSPSEVDPREATATSTIAARTPTTVRKALRVRALVSTQGETSSGGGTFAATGRDGDRQRHARQLLGRRRAPRSRRRGGGGAPDDRGGSGDRGRRRRVDAARFRRRHARRGAPAGRAGARAAPGRARVDRHGEERGRPPRARARRRARQRRDGASRRPRAGGRGRGRRRVSLPDAHAGRASHDAGRPALRRRRRRGCGIPGAAAVRGRRSRDPGGARLPRPGHRLRQDRRRTTSSCCGGSMCCSHSAAPCSSGSRARARSAGSSTRRRRRARSRRRSAPQSRPTSEAPSIFRVHDVREHVEALAAAGAVCG